MIQFFFDFFFKSFINKNQFDFICDMFEKVQKGFCFLMFVILKIYFFFDMLVFEKQGFYVVIKFLIIFYELLFFNEEVCMLLSFFFVKIGIYLDSCCVQKVQEYINVYYQEEICLNQLVDMVGMILVFFSCFFKLCIGKNFLDYIIDICLGFVVCLLVDFIMFIVEICYECGFNNFFNFNWIFKKKKECLFKEFCENYRKKKKLV